MAMPCSERKWILIKIPRFCPFNPHNQPTNFCFTVPPQPKDPSTLYGFTIGAPGDVTVNFTANPRPVRVYWKLDDGSELQVEPYGGRASPDNRFDVSDLRNTVRLKLPMLPLDGINFSTFWKIQNASAYEARLRIKTVADADARRVFRLMVESDLNGEPMMQEYVVRLSTSPAPLTCKNGLDDCDASNIVRTVDFRSDLIAGGVSGGGIAAIIIVLLAVLIIVAVSLYARNTGRWCFAG